MSDHQLYQTILDILHSEGSSQDALLDKLFEGEVPPAMYQVIADILVCTDGVFDFKTRMNVLEALQIPEDIKTAFTLAFLDEHVEGVPLAEILKGFRSRARALVPAFIAGNAPPEILGVLRKDVKSLTKEQYRYVTVELGADVLFHAETSEDPAEATPDIVTNKIVFGNEHAQRLRSAYELYRALHQRQGFVLGFRPSGRPLYSLHNMLYAIADRAAAYIGASQLPASDLKTFHAHISTLDRFLVKVVDFEKKKAILARRTQTRQSDEVLAYLPRILEIQMYAQSRLEFTREGLIRDLNDQATEVGNDLGGMLATALELKIPDENVVQRLLFQNGFLRSLWNESEVEWRKYVAFPQAKEEGEHIGISPRDLLTLTAEHFARNCDAYVADANEWLAVHGGEVPRKKLEKFVVGIGAEQTKAARFYGVAEAMQEDFDVIIVRKYMEIIEEMMDGNRESEAQLRQLQQLQAAKKAEARKMALSLGYISEEQFYAFTLLERVGATADMA